MGPRLRPRSHRELGRRLREPVDSSLGIGISRTTVFNRRPMTLGVQYYYDVERPDGSAASTLRVVISLLYPKPPGK
jgi:hypothetical protein